MNREETLAWIDHILDALDQFEVIEIINETLQEGRVGEKFFTVLDEETERYKAEGDTETHDRLHEIARTMAAIRQNRKENL